MRNTNRRVKETLEFSTPVRTGAVAERKCFGGVCVTSIVEVVRDFDGMAMLCEASLVLTRKGETDRAERM